MSEETVDNTSDNTLLSGMKRSGSTTKTKEELLKEAQELEDKERAKFVEEYNALCAKYGFTIQPQITLQVARK